MAEGNGNGNACDGGFLGGMLRDVGEGNYVRMRFNHHAPATSSQFKNGSPGKGCFGSEGIVGVCKSRGLPIRT